jgi:peptide/nickel transport system substrate-binding protein
MLLMNTTKKGLDNAAVRKAIATAIDYASIAETAMSGYSDAVQASLILPTGAEGKYFNKADAEANGWKYDPAAAEKILTDAGATKGSDGIYTIDGNRLGPYKLITPTGWTDWNASTARPTSRSRPKPPRPSKAVRSTWPAGTSRA